jgi:hypothetical protein
MTASVVLIARAGFVAPGPASSRRGRPVYQPPQY